MPEILLDRALQWIDQRLSEFDPLSQSGAFDFTRGQRLGELAILARTAAQLGGKADDPRVGRMAALLHRTQRSPVYADRLLRAPIEFMLFLEGYATLRALGLEDEPLRARLHKAVRSGWLHQTERFPHRAMDIRSCLDACGIPCDLPPLHELYRRSILAAKPNPILLHEHDLYALTHVVMFLCDFGMRPPGAIPDGERDELAALLGALTVVASRDRHWDLLAEFLLCWSCLDLPDTSLIVSGWRTLERAQRADGAVPGPEAEQLALADPSFEHVYHTTLVSALAASIRLGKARQAVGIVSPPSTAPPASRRSVGAEPADVAMRAVGWIIRAAEAVLDSNTCSASSLGQVLVGLSCCSALGQDQPCAGLVRRIAGRLGDVVSSDWPSVPPLVQCVAAASAAQAGVFVPALHGHDGLLHRAATFFRHSPPVTRQHRLEMHETWAALHALGIASEPPPISPDELSACGREMALESDAGRLEHLLLVLDAATAGGSRHLPLPGEAAWLAGLVAGLTVDACRRYDLAAASALIRTGTAIADHDPLASRVLRLGVEFLMFNQREDGAFGFVGPELAARRQQSSNLGESDLLLPLTVNCLLALAAHFRGWHPVAELGARAGAVQRMLAACPAVIA